MDRIWFKIQRHLRRSNSLQVVLLSITIHSIVSILLIYFHLGWFFDNEISKFEPDGLSGKEGGIVLARTRQQVNMISTAILNGNQTNLFKQGWWMDHSKWTHDIHCFPQKWLLCTKVLSTSCKPDTVRGIYQFLPVRSDRLLQSVEFALRASAKDLEEQSGEAAFGLHASISLSDGAEEIIKLEFPGDLDQSWTKRTVRYSSPPGTRIVDITVMLFCVGYFGTVSFTDVEVIPLSANAMSKDADLIDRCGRHLPELPPTTPAAALFKIEKLILTDSTNAKQLDEAKSALTLVTQVSMDRLTVLEKTLSTWQGPVSLAVYVPVKNVSEGLQEWQRLYTVKKIRTLNLSPQSHVTLIIGDEETLADYPINILRNIALRSATTDYVLLIDADFMPCPDLEQRFSKARQTDSKNDSAKIAFVIPAFEYIENPKKEDGAPKSKQELLQAMFLEEPIIQPFRVFESSEAHRNTDYWKWFYSSKNYRIQRYSDKYEPYIIARRTLVPEFDESFTGYGMNKVSHATELYVAGYQFAVLHDAWLIHLPHKSTLMSQDFLQNPTLRLHNRVRRFKFIRKLAWKYGASATNTDQCQEN